MSIQTRFPTSVAAVLLLLACSGDGALPVAPLDVAPTAATSTDTQRAAALTRKRALTTDLTASALIGQGGGSLEIPQAGLKITVPVGALSAPTLITVRAFAGSLVAYEFGPHGTAFAVPVRLSQELGNTNWTKVKVSAIEGAYFATAAQLDVVRNEAVIDEFLPTSVDPLARKAGFPIVHFSGYMLSSGRTKPPLLP
jgi:hypothetical protein